MSKMSEMQLKTMNEAGSCTICPHCGHVFDRYEDVSPREGATQVRSFRDEVVVPLLGCKPDDEDYDDLAG